MFGFVLVSSKNHVLLLDGDSEFKSHLWQRVEREIRAPLEAASTSSGIVTDIVEPHCPRKQPKRQGQSLLFSLTEVSHLLLPLISFYRGTHALGDPLDSSGSLDGNISFKELPNGFLIISFENSSGVDDVLFHYTKLLKVCVGPLLDLLDSDFSTVKPGRESISYSLNKHFRDIERLQFGNSLEIRRTAFYRSSVAKIYPFFKSICTQLQLFIGNNRCLLLNKGTIIATANSSGAEKPITKSFDVQDINCLVKQINNNLCCKAYDVAQYWLKSKNSVVPFYVNVIVHRLSDSLVLVCISPSKVDRFLRLVVLILMQLDQLVSGCDVERITKDISESVNELSGYLNDFVTHIKETQPDSSFLRNPVKSAQFFKSVWSRLSAELLRSTNPPPEPSPQPTRKLFQRFSLSSLKTAISSLSISSSSISMRNNNGKRVLDISMKVDVLLTHWRRQIVTLIQELCAVSRKDAINYKMPLFLDSLKRILKPNHEKLFLGSVIGDEKEESKIQNFLRPIDHKLDMLGYRVCSKDRQLAISYESELLSKDVDFWNHVSNSDNFCIDVPGNSGQTYTVYKITVPYTRESKKISLIRGLVGTTTQDEFPPMTSVTAVFNSFVNKELAFSQINRLLKITVGHFSDTSTFFQ